MPERRQILTGMKEIAEYTGMSEGLILKLIQTARFPARKTADSEGIWISNAESIDKWSYGFSMSGIAANLKEAL